MAKKADPNVFLKIQGDDFANQVCFALVGYAENGARTAVAPPVKPKQVMPDSPVRKPTFALSGEAVQDLVDALWRHGYRPTDVKGRLEHIENRLRRLEHGKAS